MDPSVGIADVLLEFMEAVVHQILFVREIYNSELFERQRLYSVAVRKARHPDLCDYIHDVIYSLREPITNSTLSKVAVVILGPDRQPVERHILEPRLLSTSQPHTTTTTNNNNLYQDKLSLLDIEAHLRAFLLKLQYMDSYLDKPPPGSSFEVVAYTISRLGVPLDAWCEEQINRNGVNGGVNGMSLELPEGEVVPIKSCRIEGAFALQLYSEREPS